MVLWIYDKEPPKDSYQQKQYDNLFKLTKNKKIAKNGSKIIDLFDVLNKNKSNIKDAEELKDSIFLDENKKEHFFTTEQSKKVFEFLKGIKKGGDLPVEQTEESGKGALNKIILRYLNFLRALLPESVKQTSDIPINFIHTFSLNNLEKIPIYGQFLGMSVSVAIAINKNVAKMLQSYTPKLVGVTGLPFGSVVGEVIGYVISLIPIFLNVMMYVSRENLGEAYTQSLAAIPVVGTAVQGWAESSDRLLEELGEKRSSMIRQLKNIAILSWLGNFLDMVIIDPNYVGNPEADALAIKQKLNSFKEQAKINFENANNKLKNQLEKYNENPQEYRNAVKNKIKSRIKPKGGKRFSTYRSKNNKWKTLRKLKKY